MMLLLDVFDLPVGWVAIEQFLGMLAGHHLVVLGCYEQTWNTDVLNVWFQFKFVQTPPTFVLNLPIDHRNQRCKRKLWQAGLLTCQLFD